MMDKLHYPIGSTKPLGIFRLTLTGWKSALKLAFFPFLLAVVVDVLLALASHFVTAAVQLYALKILSALVAFYLVGFAFYLVHSTWANDQSSWKSQLSVFSLRFFPALAAFAIIFIVTGLLIAVGEVMMKMLLPYSHMMGKVATPVLVSVIGLLGILWVLGCFYWPLYIIRDRQRFFMALYRSFAIAGLTKSVIVYVPAIAFVLVFLLVNQNLPWMRLVNSVWAFVAMGFVVKWLLGSWVLTATCLIMKESDFMLQKIDTDMLSKQQQRQEKKAKKRADKKK